ncbi:MAG: hypothetical protein KGO81_15205, partial [Bacteroidota bacterium]|nr:hypothetical protein [Bacteroidota bacterium]
MKFIFVTTMCCQLLLSPVFSQRVVPEPSFPMQDDEICFQEIVLAQHYTQDAILQKIQNWATATQRKYHLKITHSQEVANDYFINGILKIDGDKKDPYEVDCS